MSVLWIKIIEFFKIILIVFGLISIYPKVTSDNFFIYRNFKKKAIINAQFRCSNLINPYIKDIIDSGIVVNLIYKISTYVEKKTVYSETFSQKISFDGTNYTVNDWKLKSFELMTNFLTIQDLVFLTNAESFSGKGITTEVEILLKSDYIPEIINLWGNRPRITLNYLILED